MVVGVTEAVDGDSLEIDAVLGDVKIEATGGILGPVGHLGQADDCLIKGRIIQSHGLCHQLDVGLGGEFGCQLLVGIGVQRLTDQSCGAALLILLGLLQLEERPDEPDQPLPLLGTHGSQVAVDQLGNAVQQGRGIEGADIELAIIHVHAPDILVLSAAEAGFDAAQALGEHLGGITHDLFDVLVLVHPVQADGLGQVGVHIVAIEPEQDVFNGDLLVIVFTDVQIIAPDGQDACTGSGPLGIDAEGVLGAVLFLVTDDAGPGPGAILGLVAPDQSEGLHGVLVRHILGGAGTEGDIQASVEVHHLPDGAAVDAVHEMVSRIAEQILHVGDFSKGLLAQPGLGGAENLGSVHGDSGDNQLAVELTQATDAGADALQVALVVLCLGDALVDGGDGIGGRIHLVDHGQAIDTAAEVQLVLVFTGVAEQGAVAGLGPGHEDLDLAGLGVDLHQNAAGVAAVGLCGVEVAVVQHIQQCVHVLGFKIMAQDAVHKGQGAAHGIVAGADVYGIAIADCGPGIILAPVTLALVQGGDDALANIVHDAVCGAELLLLMGNLLHHMVASGVNKADSSCPWDQGHGHNHSKKNAQQFVKLTHNTSSFCILAEITRISRPFRNYYSTSAT